MKWSMNLMSAKTLTLPEEIINALRVPPDDIEAELYKELAIALYQRGMLSSGKASALSGLTRLQIHLIKIGRLHLLREFHKKILRKDLHEGESETIALAVEEMPEIVFLDESEARRIAKVYGFNITGVIGILIRAKREGLIPSLREELDKLRNEAGFWIGDDIYRKALCASEEEVD